MDTVLQSPAQLTAHLRAARHDRGLTQTELAQRLGISQARYARIEARPGTIATAQLLAVLTALGLEVVLRFKPTAARAKKTHAVQDRDDW
jgi:HTH-type transcriptional regulator / antitoxin HipB